VPVRAITFDFWRTLFTDRREPTERRELRVEAVARASGADPDAVRSALKTAEIEFLRHHIDQQRTLGPPDAVRIVARELSLAFDTRTAAELAEIFGAAILHHPPAPIEGALEAVRAAAARYPVGILSDAGISPGRSLRVLLDRHGFTRYLRCLAFSDEVGVAKPQARMFETAARGLGVQTDELLHIGDLEGTDVIGARRVGARAGLFTGDNERYRNGTTADYTFENWDEFIAQLITIS
jgi:putative hydrolase of the HAD superfamily